jgi:hypothetical protein
MFSDSIRWLHNNISPIVFGAVFVTACFLHDWSAYLFTAEVLFLLIVWPLRIVIAMRDNGVFRRGLNLITETTQSFWNQVQILKERWWAKPILTVVVLHLAIAPPIWIYHHVDLLGWFDAAVAFIYNSPELLLNAHLFVEAVQVKMNKGFLQRLMVGVQKFASFEYDLIVNRPAAGLGLMVVVTAAFMVPILVLSHWNEAMTWTDTSPTPRVGSSSNRKRMMAHDEGDEGQTAYDPKKK